MHKVFLQLVLFATILVGAWAIVNMKFDIRRYASGEPTFAPQYTLTPSSLPSPNQDHLPQITTSSLPVGIRGVAYSASIRGVDPDANDTLYMNMSTLPQGLTRGPCSLTGGSASTQADCGITGTPTSPGSYSINVTLTDRAGHSVSRTFPLTIGPTPVFSPTPIPTSTPRAVEMSITTTRLGFAYVGRSYRSKISGYISPSSSTNLRFTSPNLPAGLAISNCTTLSETSRTTLNCEISGTPRAPGGNFPVRLILSGPFSATEKTLNLIVINFPF